MPNTLIPRPNLTKIPGELPISQPERYIDDLSKLTKTNLLEIKKREEKLLSNKSRISKLPDKGKKIKDFYEKVLKEISLRDEVEKAAALFSELNIASTGQEKLNNLEWTGKYDPKTEESVLDSDDEDEIDPLKIIAGSMSEKKVKISKPEKLLITDDDLKEIESFKNEIQNDEDKSVVNIELVEKDALSESPTIKLAAHQKLNGISSSQNSSTSSLDLDPHTLYLFEKENGSLPQREKFKPYKTTKSNVHDPEKEKLRKPLGKHWEVTAATPPPIQHSGTQLLSLHDSVEIQVQYLEKLKKLQEKQAEERLAARATRKSEHRNVLIMGENLLKLKSFFGDYRTALDDVIESSDSEDEVKIFSDDEVHDDDYEKSEGGVTYPVYD